jgi:hypothetical protein
MVVANGGGDPGGNLIGVALVNRLLLPEDRSLTLAKDARDRFLGPRPKRTAGHYTSKARDEVPQLAQSGHYRASDRATRLAVNAVTGHRPELHTSDADLFAALLAQTVRSVFDLGQRLINVGKQLRKVLDDAEDFAPLSRSCCGVCESVAVVNVTCQFPGFGRTKFRELSNQLLSFFGQRCYGAVDVHCKPSGLLLHGFHRPRGCEVT